MIFSKNTNKNITKNFQKKILKKITKNQNYINNNKSKLINLNKANKHKILSQYPKLLKRQKRPNQKKKLSPTQRIIKTMIKMLSKKKKK